MTTLTAQQIRARAATNTKGAAALPVPTPKVGAAIFEGTSYPRTWDAYIGQAMAKEQLMAACEDAVLQDKRLDHVMIATGFHGVGKTALAKLIAAHLKVGLVEIQGKVSEEQGRAILMNMADNDVLFWDEMHQAVAGGKAAVEWMLPVLQDGKLITPRGVEYLPNITVVAATTDAHKLPETILSRFKLHPVIAQYTELEGAQIASTMARRVITGLPQPDLATCVAIAKAANCNPRAIDRLLTHLRIAATTKWATFTEAGHYDLGKAFEWAGVTPDGLDDLAQRYLMTLLKMFDGRTGEKTIASALGEPTPPRHTEKLLVQKDLLTITAKGRQLTEDGIERAVELLTARGDIE